MQVENLAECPLCRTEGMIYQEFELKAEKKLWPRTYLRCPNCRLIYLRRDQVLEPVEEKLRYDNHQNVDTPEYRDFLSLLWGELRPNLLAGEGGIDFGCGPSPVLAKLIREDGFSCETYDPFYFPDAQVLETQYSFLTSTEVIEHLMEPHKVFEQMDGLVKPKGFIGLMTEKFLEQKEFRSWHYIRDLTHINFFSEETCDWIAQSFNWQKLESSDRVTIYQKL